MLSSNLGLAILLVFLIGALLFGIGTALVRSAGPKTRSISWPRLIDEDLTTCTDSERLDMIERLSLLRSDWSFGVLREARKQESDRGIRAAIERALQ